MVTKRPGRTAKDRALRTFMDRAVKAGAEVKRFATRTAAMKSLLGIIKSNGWGKVAVAPDARPFVPRGPGVEWLAPGDLSLDVQADAGLVTADFGLGSTGTLVHLDTGDADRIVWTAPPVCLCFLRKRSVFAEAEEIAGRAARHLLPRRKPRFAQVSFVTGPSRTADIEAELTLGVHGPGRLIILLYGS